MKTIILAGATGFVGSHLTRKLLLRGFKVVVLLRKTSNRSKLPLESANLRFFEASNLNALTKEYTGRVHVFINAATAYGRSCSPQEEVTEANIDFPKRLLHAASDLGCSSFINFDSFFSKPGLEHSYLPCYTASKRIFLEHARQFLKNGNRITFYNLRLEHVYGPGDSPTKFISWLIELLIRNEPFIPLTSGLQQRDFLFISDVVDATLALIETPDRYPGELVEVGAGTETATSVQAFAKLAKQLAGSSSHLGFGALPPVEREIDCSVADAKHLKSIGWSAKFDVKSGISELIAQTRSSANR